MTGLLDGLCEESGFKTGDEVQTLRSSMRGKIVRVLADGRVVWRTNSGAELTALPESLIRQMKQRK